MLNRRARFPLASTERESRTDHLTSQGSFIPILSIELHGISTSLAGFQWIFGTHWRLLRWRKNWPVMNDSLDSLSVLASGCQTDTISKFHLIGPPNHPVDSHQSGKIDDAAAMNAKKPRRVKSIREARPRLSPQILRRTAV